MIDQNNLPKKKYHVLKNIRNKSLNRKLIPKFSSVIAQFFIIKRDAKKLVKDFRSGIFLIGKIVFKNKFTGIKE